MKRIISLITLLALVSTLFTAFFAVEAVAATVISNTSPAITANVGDTVNLSAYSVVFDGDTSATESLSWKDFSGTDISSVNVTAKGVTKLTASSGSKSKTVYLVAKNPSESEYVLYEANFASYSSIDQLKTEGWAFLNDASYYSLSGGDLVMGSLEHDYVRAIMPAWLGDFGDYSVTANAKMLTSKDTGRWFGVVYRIQNANGAYYPYYHMCTREATTSSGIEFAERTADNAWNVQVKANGTVSSLKNAYTEFNVQAYGTTVRQSLDRIQATYTTNSVIGVNTGTYLKGMLGFTVNYATVGIRSVKVCVQETAPERSVNLVNPNHEELPLINPIANVQTVSASQVYSVLGSADAPGIVYLDASTLSDFSTVIYNCKQNSVIPTFKVTTTAQVDSILAASTTHSFSDINIVSATASILSYVRGKNSIIRTGLIVNLTNGDLTDKEADVIRRAVRSAPATFCVIESANATKKAVSEIQEFAVAVWVIVSSAVGTDAFNVEAVKAVTSGANGIISASSSELAKVINTHLVDNAMTRTPIMIGHRGNPSQAPENTLSGFIKAYENGADIFEVDVEITSDNQIVIMHDNTINRTTNYTGTKTVNQMTLAEIKQYYIKLTDGTVTTEKVPTLKEVLDEFQDKDCKIFIEFKGSNASNVPYTCALLQQYGMEYLVDVISFAPQFLNQAQTEIPGMSTGYLHSPATVGTVDEVLESLYNSISLAQSSNSTLNIACGIIGSGYYTQAVTDRGMTVWPWTYYYSNVDSGFMSGCDGVTTDDMQWVTDMAKVLHAEVSNPHILVGQEMATGVLVESYGNEFTSAHTSQTVASVISGGDCVAVVNGRFVGLKEGSAQVVVGYPTRTTSGSEYVVYTQPFTITVGGNASLTQLIDKAYSISFDDYKEANLVRIRELVARAQALNASFDANNEEIKAVASELASLLNGSYYAANLSVGKNYTTTAPNRGEGNLYNDDGIRLTDGGKNNTNGGSSAYSGWSSLVGGQPNVVDVIVDLESTVESNVYSVYFAGGNWGIPVPNGSCSFKVFGSDDNSVFEEITSADTAVLTSGTGAMDSTWSTFKMTAQTDSSNSYRYIKFQITNTASTNAFVWIDEVEIYRNVDLPVQGGVYVTGFNTKIISGAVQIFTPDFGTVTTANANHTWAAYLVAKWDSAIGQYVVQSKGHGSGTATTPDITLASDEILVVAHKWEGDGVDNPVVGSAQNMENFTAASVGDVILFNGIDIENKELGVAPYISYASADEFITGGDINGDGTVNALDYQLLKRKCLGTYSFGEKQELAGDINGDGSVNALDYQLLKRACLGTYSIKA